MDGWMDGWIHTLEQASLVCQDYIPFRGPHFQILLDFEMFPGMQKGSEDQALKSSLQ